ncbi:MULTISPECIES: transposase [unclassified Kitasatospora]|uniref:transposase n=1 Tax=unclassified Kitasatospora TaxID=2633591 RepID=UPI00340E0B9B
MHRADLLFRRHGTASIVAALDVRTGEVLTDPIARNNAATFTVFLDRLNAVIAPDKEIHVVLDNGSSHTAKHAKAWFASHPSWHVPWTPPHASWLNQVELFLSALTRRVLRHGDFANRDDLIDTMDTYVLGHNKAARRSSGRRWRSTRSAKGIPRRTTYSRRITPVPRGGYERHQNVCIHRPTRQRSYGT